MNLCTKKKPKWNLFSLPTSGFGKLLYTMTSGLTPVSPGVRNAVWYASSVSEVCFDFCLVSFGSLLWESVQLPFAALSFPLSTMTTLLQPHLNIMTTTPCYPSPCLSITWIRSAKNSSSVWLKTSDLRQVLYTKKNCFVTLKKKHFVTLTSDESSLKRRIHLCTMTQDVKKPEKKARA